MHLRRRRQGRTVFFSEEKKQKTFAILAASGEDLAVTGEQH
jgi:hypothetical protein